MDEPQQEPPSPPPKVPLSRRIVAALCLAMGVFLLAALALVGAGGTPDPHDRDAFTGIGLLAGVFLLMGIGWWRSPG